MTIRQPVPQRRGLQSLQPFGDRQKAFHRAEQLGEALLKSGLSRRKKWRGPADEACSAAPTRLVSGAVGRIEHILLTVPRGEGGHLVNPWDEEHLRRVVELLGGTVRFTIVCQFDQQDLVQGWFRDLGISESQLSLVLSKYDYSIWAQDAFLALDVEDQGPSLVEGVRFLRQEDMVIADDVAAQTEIGHLHSILDFQGGNILAGTEVHLVGWDYIALNVGRVRLETSDLVIEEFERLFGGKVQWVGTPDFIPESERRGTTTGNWQPLFHIDMFVTRTGETRDGRELLLVGSPRLAREILKQPERPRDQDLYYDQIASQLEGYDFEVERIPLLPVRESPSGWPALDYVLTWNNVLLENYVGHNGDPIRRVILPSYQDAENRHDVDQEIRSKLDEAAIKLWGDLGFEVELFEHAEDLAYVAGVVHCITKVLERSHLPSPPDSAAPAQP